MTPAYMNIEARKARYEKRLADKREQSKATAKKATEIYKHGFAPKKEVSR